MGVAVVCSQLSSFSGLSLQNRAPLAAPGPKQVSISVEAAAMSYVDLLMLSGKYQWKPTLPFVPGGEVAGRVGAIGSGCRRLQLGHEVYAACTVGGYASEVIVDEEQVFKLPSGLSMAEAAASVSSFGTAYHALVDRARLQENERLLILGAAGSVGTAAVQVGRMLKAKVFAATSSKQKEDYVKAQGAEQALPSDPTSLRTELKNIDPMQVVLDTLGGPYSELAFRALATGGRHLVLGFVTNSIARLPLNLPLLKMADVRGVFWSRFRKEHPAENRKNFGILSNAFAQKTIRPSLIKKYPLSEYETALKQLKNRSTLGKQVLIIEK